MKKRGNVIWITVLVLAHSLLNTGQGTAGKSNVKELAKLSIEELISIKVTSVLKTSQPMAESPAAVYVLTRQDILRSGAANIPDLLRLVPGVQVAEVDENIYAVSIRGFNDIHANKLLVMVDGRSVYNHIFSGVIWPMMDLIMEDIDRIEVIRGPGSSTWGANAVNGVINIITRKAEETKGALIQFGGGHPDKASASVRYGGDLGKNGAFRVYAKRDTRNNDHLSQPGFNAKTGIDSEMGGFRADWRWGDSDSLTFQGEIVKNESETIERRPESSELNRFLDQKAWHLLSRWQHSFSEQSKTRFNFYYQQDKREDQFQFDTIDLDFQHDYTFFPSHQFAWGLGYRFISDQLMQGLYGSYTYDPEERDLHLFSFFIQDTIRLIPDDLNLTIGSKFEHNDYTGIEIQPSLRLGWTPHERHFLWGSVSRAVRTPSRVDSDSSAFLNVRQPQNLGSSVIEIRGSDNFGSEELIACEIGYRVRPLDELWFDIAGFYNVYDKLTTYEKKENNVRVIANDMEGDTYGFEVSADWQPVEWWKLSGSWSFMKMDIQLKNSRAADLTGYAENTSPQNQFSVHSALNLGRRVTVDLWMRHVDDVRHMLPFNGLPGRTETIEAYTAFDARLAWKPVKELELSVTGRNLGGTHQEFTHYEAEQSLFFNVKIEL